MQTPAPYLRKLALPMIALVIALACGTACRGPQLHINNPDEHDVFVDGRRSNADSLDFRYYGRSRWDTLPKIQQTNGVPEFDRNPHSGTVEIQAPASPWLFPLDFPLEIISWAVFGQQDQTVTVTSPKKPEDQRVGQQIAGEKLGQLSARARAARVAR